MNFLEGQILAFDKPLGATSFSVVGRVRRLISQKMYGKKLRVGHAGTLDPLASGVLVLCTGRATKVIDRLQSGVKEYVAEVKLGATTPSFDRETEEDGQYAVEHITRELVEGVLPQFVGEIMQVPPVYSACKVGGKRAYDMARKGEEVELKAKPLRIDELELLEYVAPDRLRLRVLCSKGTYIRALVRDLGVALGSGAYLWGLRRTRVGEFGLEDCWKLEAFEDWLEEQEVSVLAPEGSLPKDYPRVWPAEGCGSDMEGVAAVEWLSRLGRGSVEAKGKE